MEIWLKKYLLLKKILINHYSLFKNHTVRNYFSCLNLIVKIKYIFFISAFIFSCSSPEPMNMDDMLVERDNILYTKYTDHLILDQFFLYTLMSN